jgi:cytochrome c oxidase subunit II
VPPTARDRPPRKVGKRGALIVLATLFLAGCGRQSTLSPRSPQTHDTRTLWWWMLGAAAVVFFGAVALLAVAWRRRATPGLPFFGQREPVAQGMVLLFGIAIPIVALIALFGGADVYLVGQTAPPNPRTTALTVEVIGHQWWWEVHYRPIGGSGSSAVTANEIHIPVRTRVNVVAVTADVIHSFWVPQLARKIDMIPGRQNRILLYASRPGTYRGQCAEFCGLQHAHMSLEVVAQPASAFRAWLANMASPARTPAGGPALVGRRLFMTDQCASCHTISGTPAQGTVGPDLSHLATRSTLAADTIPNNPSELERWILNPQAIKPGDRMPDLGLTPGQAREIVAYLDSLK